jgi:hypothetical protein
VVHGKRVGEAVLRRAGIRLGKGKRYNSACVWGGGGAEGRNPTRKGH